MPLSNHHELIELVRQVYCGGGGEAVSEWGQERGRQTERLEEEAGREQRGKRGKKSKGGVRRQRALLVTLLKGVHVA